MRQICCYLQNRKYMTQVFHVEKKYVRHTVWCILSCQNWRSLFLGRYWIYSRSDCCSRTVWGHRMLDFNGSFHHQQFFFCTTQSQCSHCSVSISKGFMLKLASLICQTYKSMSPVSAQIYLKYSRSSEIIVTVWGKTKVAGGEKNK